jgi:hypothetical protein
MTKEEKAVHYQALRTETLKLAMTILDTRTARLIEHQQLLPPGRQEPVAPYSATDVCSEAAKLLAFVLEAE